MVKLDMAMVLLDPGFNRMTSLSSADLLTLADAINA
jgi:hypothetical protein